MNKVAEYELRYATRFDIDMIKHLLDSAKDVFGFIPRPAVGHSVARGELIVVTPICFSQEVIGFCRFHKRRDGITTIYEIFVKEKHRKHGIGRRMINALKGKLRAKCPVEFSSNAFYKAIGFKLIVTEAGKRKPLNVWENG